MTKARFSTQAYKGSFKHLTEKQQQAIMSIWSKLTSIHYTREELETHSKTSSVFWWNGGSKTLVSCSVLTSMRNSSPKAPFLDHVLTIYSTKKELRLHSHTINSIYLSCIVFQKSLSTRHVDFVVNGMYYVYKQGLQYLNMSDCKMCIPTTFQSLSCLVLSDWFSFRASWNQVW